MEELKESINMMSSDITNLMKQNTTITGLLTEIKLLKTKNMEQEKKIAFLENRVSDLEQYSRMNDVVVSGLQTKPRPYARAVSTETSSETTMPDQDSIEQQVIAFFDSKGISVKSDNIEACHPLPRRNKADKPALIIRFTNRKHKNALLRQGRKLKGSDVYVNEHLTPKNGAIAKKARFLKKHKKIQSTWTANCKVCIKLNGSPEEAKVLVIKEMEELDKYQ
ncbi:hypothetical protein DPX16_5388 [Xyrichtys novacula]|uniref:Uncharacterized protein n=1 Tax=Xyrichtys novacula TaxID=13765 RepID=A0AAV1H8X9_XYRNO|nr:hypothetical protein DPX16_5388 [Xyrichtys novacula]